METQLHESRVTRLTSHNSRPAEKVSVQRTMVRSSEHELRRGCSSDSVPQIVRASMWVVSSWRLSEWHQRPFPLSHRRVHRQYCCVGTRKEEGEGRGIACDSGGLDGPSINPSNAREQQQQQQQQQQQALSHHEQHLSLNRIAPTSSTSAAMM